MCAAKAVKGDGSEMIKQEISGGRKLKNIGFPVGNADVGKQAADRS